MAENVTGIEAQLVVAVDTSFLLLTGMNILLMQAGFTALEAGGSRAKNVKSLLFKNFMDHAAGALAWFTIGWGLFIGADPFAAGPDATFFVHPVAQYARLFQQFAFAATAATIVSGAVTGRCRLEPYVVLSAFMSGISYPISGHWAWDSSGWLAQMGFLDFAGSTVVHGFGGAVALVCAWMCGSRPGRFVTDAKRGSYFVGNTDPSHTKDLSNHPATEDGKNNSEAEGTASSVTPFTRRAFRCTSCRLRNCRRPVIYKTRVVPKGHNPPMMVVGTLLLYVAWFSFNGGSSGSITFAPDGAVRAAVNTMLAAGAASIASFVLTILARAKYDVEIACNCTLAGLVAITAPCGYVDPWSAVVLGFLSAPVYLISAWFVLHVLGVDDVLGAVSVHGTCGVFGTLWLGLTHPDLGLFYGHGAHFLGVQALGCICITGWAAVTGFVCVILPFWMFGKLTYSQSEQLLGIDFLHFGGEYGRDVDLESDPHRRNSMHSEREDLESNDGKSGNSSFVEEFPGNSQTTHSNDGGVRAGQVLGVASDNPLRMVRSLSTNTFEGRKALNTELKRVLDEDPRMRHRFRAYLEVMHRDEGVAFWDEVIRWKSISAKKYADKKVKEAKRIIKTYCLDTGTKQVNLASKLMKQLRDCMDDREELLKNSLFDLAMDEMFKDLRQQFSEFVENTPNYWM